MSETVIVGILALIGTLGGSWLGVRQANKLVNWRIDRLEAEVRKHNSLVERVAVVERDLKTAFNRVDDLKEEMHHL